MISWINNDYRFFKKYLNLQRINVLIDVTSDEIDNICNSFSAIDINKEKQLYQIYENYIKHLNELYKKKEQKFKDIYNKYNRSLLVLKKMEGNKSNLNINEIINNKQKDIEEVKQEFNLEKNLLKNELDKNINLINSKEKLQVYMKLLIAIRSYWFDFIISYSNY